ncbi:MAG: hypothetical protein ACI87A_003238 [Planctomycetota bacterium]
MRLDRLTRFAKRHRVSLQHFGNPRFPENCVSCFRLNATREITSDLAISSTFGNGPFSRNVEKRFECSAPVCKSCAYLHGRSQSARTVFDMTYMAAAVVITVILLFVIDDRGWDPKTFIGLQAALSIPLLLVHYSRRSPLQAIREGNQVKYTFKNANYAKAFATLNDVTVD